MEWIRCSPTARRDWCWGLLGAALLYASYPPLNQPWLGWIAPACWIHLASRPDLWQRGTVWRLYGCGWIFWMAVLQWIRLPHPATYAGWVALSAYLAIYVPCFIGSTHWWTHRRGWPLWLAAPISWVGLELLRSTLMTGFAMIALGHSQSAVLPILQLASLGGVYLISGLMVLVAASLTVALSGPVVTPSPPNVAVRRTTQRRFGPLVASLMLTAVAWWWGDQRLTSEATTEPATRAAVIQGSIDTTFDGDPEFGSRTMEEYLSLTQQAVRDHEPLDLVIWPESMFGADAPLVKVEQPAARPPEFQDTEQEYRDMLDQLVTYGERKMKYLSSLTGTYSLVGAQFWEADPQGRRLYNSALLINPQGQLTGRYDKMHTVMFGEYIPLGEWFPWIYRLTPLPNGLTSGTGPQLFVVGQLRISPTVCFENLVPHLVRRQLAELARKEQAGKDGAPNCLVTITNDGWFWGSSLLDLHLACGAFRAVESDLPLLIAANTGFSAHVSPRGKLLAVGPRRKQAVLLMEVVPGAGQSWYRRLGDWPFWPAVPIAVWPCLLAVYGRLRARRRDAKLSVTTETRGE
ncbi:MAG: apolipoprotein N-acyltransferase [Pirellulales bacterium]